MMMFSLMTSLYLAVICSMMLCCITEAFNQPQHAVVFRRMHHESHHGRSVMDQTFSYPTHRLRLAMDDFDDDDDDDDDDEILSDEELAATMQEWDNRIARFNTVHLTGRVGNEPEAKYFDDGKVVVNLSLASKRKYLPVERKYLGVQTGDEGTDWYGLEIWGQTAEYVAKYVEKGARVSVVGSLQIDEWKDKATGEPRCRAKVIVRDFDVLESKAEANLRRSSRESSSSDEFFGRPSSAPSSRDGASRFFD